MYIFLEWNHIKDITVIKSVTRRSVYIVQGVPKTLELSDAFDVVFDNIFFDLIILRYL